MATPGKHSQTEAPVRQSPSIHVTTQDRGSRTWGAAATFGLLLAAVLPAVCATAVTPGTLATARAPGADTSSLVAALALLTAWVVIARLAITAVAVVLAHLPGAFGSVARRVALVASPALLRSFVRVAAGVVAVATPLTATTAALADIGPSSGSGTAATVRIIPAGTVPVLDRRVADAGTVTVPRVVPGPVAPTRTIVVRSGDTLWSIAERSLPQPHTQADVARSWPRWFAANRAVIGADPGLIRPREQLAVPPP
jgi:hypothetical protein